MIEVKGISVMKSGRRLFDNFSWTVGTDHWVISGANGSGKTILLELLAGVVHASHGEVVYDFISGTTWDERFSERKRKIHYIPAHAIQAFLQGHELFYQQRYYSIGDERIPLVKDFFEGDLHRLHALEFPSNLNIEALLNLEVTRLSNGQLKKMLILKNLTRELPNVLLFDYPFEGLDHESRNDLADFMDHLGKEYSIQIIITDHSHVLPGVINRRLVLNQFAVASIEMITHESEIKISSGSSNAAISNSIPVVEMKNVTIKYDCKEIIRNLNWTIRRGERWALTGKNGSGKTTLFSLIFADHPMAYSQQVFLFGKRRGSGESIWDIKNRINYLGPELISYLNPNYISITARDYIITQNKHVDSATLNNALHYFDATPFANEPVKFLSSGELQLMLVISSLLSGKEMLLLDEPFQFLNPANKERVCAYIQSNLQSETTLILITHYERDIIRWTNHRMHL